QMACAEEGIALSETHGFPLWLGVAKMLRGWALAMTGDAAAGLEEVSHGMALFGDGTQIGLPLVLATQAEVYFAAARYADAIACVERALAASVACGEAGNDADLHRLRGECLLAESRAGQTRAERALSAAEECFRHAVEVARSQEARSLELRAATSLARLWRDQGKRAEARDLLAPLYAWFTEGFDTRDLIDAKALLEELT
ncbi:MAG TPA: hypothetical protein VL403_08360, partial [Candidatus Kryptonia bacterium]|nr:hypothetical protein [Candidatus Kryptonia bacterium]